MTDAATDAAGRQRTTRQATAVEDALRTADGFRSAQELHADLRRGGHAVGLTTVYRHLNLLAASGLADVVHREDGESQFRLCGEPAAGPSHHHHLVCRVCGRSLEVVAPEVEEWAARTARAAGFTEVTHTVEVFGRCPEHGR